MKKLISVLLVIMLILSLAACAGKKDDQQAADAAAPTGEVIKTEQPTEPAETEPDEPSEGWELDIDGDGSPDTVVIDAEALAAGSASPVIRLADGTELTLPMIATSHAGFGTYAIYEDAGKQMLLEYRPSWYGGDCEDVYNVYSVKDGALNVLYSGSISFEVSAERPLQPVDKDNVLGFVDEINEVWAKSRMLFSTDTDIALKQTYSRGGSEAQRVEIEGSCYIQNGDENYYCIEQLERLDAEFGIDAANGAVTAEMRLDIANEIMRGGSASGVKFEGNFMELKLDTPVLADLDGDGADDTMVIKKTVVGNYYDYYHTVTITLAAHRNEPYVDKIDRCIEFSGALVDCDPDDGRLELVFCFDRESNDYETFVYRVNASGKVQKFEEAMYFGTGISYYEGFPEDFVFDPADGLPCERRTEILGTHFVEGRFTVTEEGIEYVTEMYVYPNMHDEFVVGRLTLTRELTLTLLDDSFREKGSITLPAGSVIFPHYTDRESWVIVDLEDGRMAKASVLIVDSGDEWGIYINDIRQDELAEIPYAD